MKEGTNADDTYCDQQDCVDIVKQGQLLQAAFLFHLPSPASEHLVASELLRCPVGCHQQHHTHGRFEQADCGAHRNRIRTCDSGYYVQRLTSWRFDKQKSSLSVKLLFKDDRFFRISHPWTAKT